MDLLFIILIKVLIVKFIKQTILFPNLITLILFLILDFTFFLFYIIKIIIQNFFINPLTYYF